MIQDKKIDVKNMDIRQYLLHRYPFLLIDGVSSVLPGSEIIAYKNVSYNEWFFQGHFPENPVFPGVFMIEALAQAACVLMSCAAEIDIKKCNTYLTNVEKANFKLLVKPGDRLDLYVNISQCKTLGQRGQAGCKEFFKFSGQAKVGDSLACACDFAAVLVCE